MSSISNAVSKIFGLAEEAAPKLMFGDVELPSTTKNILIAGGPGSGKTNAVRHILPQLRESGQKVIAVCDCDVLGHEFKEGDIVFNPFDTRFPNWDLWGEFKCAYDFDVAARAMTGGDEFATQLLARFLKFSKSYDELASFMNLSVGEILAMVGFARDQNGEVRQFTPIEVVKAQRIVSSLGLFAPKTSGEPEFCLREWATNKDDKRWVFLPVRADQQEILKPVISLVLELVSKELLSSEPKMALPIDKRQSAWIIEQGCLNSFPGAVEIMAVGHRYGVNTLFEAFSIEQLESAFGTPGIGKLFNTYAVHRMMSHEHAETMARYLNEEFAFGGEAGFPPIVSASELMALPKLSCHVFIEGYGGSATVQLPIYGI
ncbi:MAG: type IV secretion system DNA-binding domain-containing protein [Azonexaceae bacterium]|nr:type IV secretion system DNA-binding domain-containing protein [Azonexaceae bacterium]